MELICQREGTSLTVSVSGRLDVNTAPELEDALDKNLQGVKQLILDFEDLWYISSAGLRTLIQAMDTMRSQGTFKVIHMGDFVRDIMDNTGLLEEIDAEE